MIHRVPEVPKMWCGPTALASVFALEYAEADEILRKIRNQKKRVVSTNPGQLLKACDKITRARKGVTRKSYFIPVEAHPQEHPKIRELPTLNTIVRSCDGRGWVPAMMFSGPTVLRYTHVMAYDHRRKLLCDTNTQGRKMKISEHPLRHEYFHGLIVLPEEFYND